MRPSTPPSRKHAVWSAAVHAPVRFGSLMKGYRLPRLSSVWEKSPRRSSSVGIRYDTASLPPVRGRNSSAWKKNSLLVPPGFPIGPPIEYPISCCFRMGFGVPLRMLALLFSFQSEFRRTLYNEPRKRLVPLLLTAVTCSPLDRPYSA